MGVRNEDVGEVVDAGAVHLFYGSDGGIDVFSNRIWHQDSEGIDDKAENNDHFGCSLAAIPSPRTIFADDFESGGTTEWSSTVGVS